MQTILNLGLFKAGWVAVVLLAAAGKPVASTAAALTVVFIHVARSPGRRGDLRLLVAAGLIGLAWESTLVALGVVSYPSGSFAAAVAPTWIVAMWLLFATTLNVSMRWLRKSVPVAAIAGAAGGALAFIAGEKAGAVVFADPVVSVVIIAAGWAVLLPLLVRLAEYFEDRDDTRSLPAGLAREPGQ